MGWDRREGAAQGPPPSLPTPRGFSTGKGRHLCAGGGKRVPLDAAFPPLLPSAGRMDFRRSSWEGENPHPALPCRAVWIGKLRHGVTGPLGPLQITVQGRAVPKAVDKTLAELKPALRHSLEPNLRDPTLSSTISSFLGIILWDTWQHLRFLAALGQLPCLW